MLPLLDNFIAANKASKSTKGSGWRVGTSRLSGRELPTSPGPGCQAGEPGGQERPPLLSEPTQVLSPDSPQPSFSP